MWLLVINYEATEKVNTFGSILNSISSISISPQLDKSKRSIGNVEKKTHCFSFVKSASNH